jgi:hypothetical protein
MHSRWREFRRQLHLDGSPSSSRQSSHQIGPVARNESEHDKRKRAQCHDKADECVLELRSHLEDYAPSGPNSGL